MSESNLRLKAQMLQDGWAQVPLFVLRLPSEKMSATTKLVYSAILWRIREGGGGQAFPSYETIAQDAGVGRATVGRALADLNEMKLITWTRRGQGQSNDYTIEEIPDELRAYGRPVSSQNDTTSSIKTGPLDGSGRYANRSSEVEEVEVEEAPAPPVPKPAAEPQLSLFSSPAKKPEETTAAPSEADDIRSRLMRAHSIASQAKGKSMAAKLLRVDKKKAKERAKERVVVAPLETPSEGALTPSRLWRWWNLQMASILKLPQEQMGRWRRHQLGQARLLLEAYEDHEVVRDYVTWIMTHWLELRTQYNLNEPMPSIGIALALHSKWMPMVGEGRPIKRVGLMRGEFNPTTAAKDPEMGWGEE